MAYGMSYKEALELLQERAKQDYCWVIRQLNKLFKR